MFFSRRADTTADFSGTILLQLNNSSGNSRGAFMVINDAYAAANAEIKITNLHNNTNNSMGLGINADTVKIAGLSEGSNVTTLATYTLFSGDSSGSAQRNTYAAYGSRGGMHTLEITGSGVYSSSIKVLNNISLAMSGSGTSLAINVSGNATLSNGALDKAVTVRAGAALTLDEKVASFSGTKFTLEDGSTANLKGNKIAGDFTLNGSAALTSGTLKVKSLDPAAQGLLQDMTVPPRLIEGFGRPTSPADGLEIESTADLMIKGMTITADNKISVGQNTITLNDVTIKLSQASYELVSGVYYFNLSDLFHCSVDMVDVVFDASDLSLPEGFNPETNGISFNLGDAKLTSETAERDIYLLMGGYGSRTMSIDEQGRPVFTALVPTPEPTTGTLSLLALAALAARRRK